MTLVTCSAYNNDTGNVSNIFPCPNDHCLKLPKVVAEQTTDNKQKRNNIPLHVHRHLFKSTLFF